MTNVESFGSTPTTYTNQTPATTATTATKTGSTNKQENLMGGLDSDSYLQLFLASLKNQDPTSAMDTSEMMQQLSLLSQMQAVYSLQDTVNEMSSNLLGSKIQQGASLLGKEITAVDANGKLVKGKAEDLSISGDLIQLLVEGKKVSLGEVSNVSLVKE